jgi:hypothetical protein
LRAKEITRWEKRNGSSEKKATVMALGATVLEMDPGVNKGHRCKWVSADRKPR